MGDLRDMLDDIDSSEKETAMLQTKVDKLMRVIEKQKAVISDLERLLDEQKSKAAGMMEVPEDIRELKAMIGEQRAIINEKDSEIEHVKGDLVQAQTELSLSRKQMIPTQQKLKEYVENIGQLQTEITERNSEIMFKNDKINNLENKINTLELANKNIQEELKKKEAEAGEHTDGIKDKHKKEIEELEQFSKSEIEKLEQKFSEERQELKAKIRSLESELSEAKLKKTEIETEASDSIAKYKDLLEAQEGLIKKVEELTKIKREYEEESKILNEKMDEMKEDGVKIWYYDKLSKLMEHDDQFKAFLILEKVGALTIEDLQKALGSPSVMVGRFVKALKDVGIVEENDMGKLVVKDMPLEE